MKRNLGFTSIELLIVIITLFALFVVLPAFYLGAAALTVAIANLFGASLTYSWGTLVLLALGWFALSAILKSSVTVKKE